MSTKGTALPFQLRCLRAGQVIRFVSAATTSEKEHWFVVLNADPESDKVFLLSIFTSNIEKLRLTGSPDTIVEIDANDFSALTKPTSIDCNRLFQHEAVYMANLHRDKKIDYSNSSRLSEKAFERVKSAVRASKLVTPAQKRMLPD